MEEKERKLLLIIDPQNDFVDTEGTLYVPGAESAVKELCRWIGLHKKDIDHIAVTQDTHRSYHIGHSMYWEQTPEPYTIITSELVKNKTYTPVICNKDPKKLYSCIEYLETIEKRGLKHIIWPEHCIAGSWGWCLPKNLVEALNYWSLSNYGKEYTLHQKGWKQPDKEMYSAFSLTDGFYTEEGCNLRKLVDEYDKIYIAGFAKDYCVAESVKYLVSRSEFKNKLIFLNNCMASINKNSENLKVFEDAVNNFGATEE